MKLRNLFLAIFEAIVLSALVLPGCTKPTGTEVGLGKEFTLSIGQSATVTGENLSFKFIEVVSDSRCPTGATCIWAGEISCLIEITLNTSTFSKTLTQPGLTEEPSVTNFENYDIQFNIQPYPAISKQISEKDYRLQLLITKSTPDKPGGGAVVNSDSVVTAKIQGITKQIEGYPWKLDVLIEYTQSVDSLPNPVQDSVDKVVTVVTDEDMTSYKINDVVLGRIKYVGDVNTPGGIRLYMYNVTPEIKHQSAKWFKK